MEIRISELCSIRRGLQPIELLLGDSLNVLLDFIYVSLKLKLYDFLVFFLKKKLLYISIFML
jgi:hypothetical protein